MPYSEQHIKTPTILLQEIDCNCSDCTYMVRSTSSRQKSVDLHYRWQKDSFDKKRMRMIEKSEFWRDKGENEKAKLLLKEARKLIFQFDESECAIHYGGCDKFNKDVSFIPNICQLETQECFEHRRVHKRDAP